MRKRAAPRKTQHYNPNLGFIGNSEVKVANYLFSAQKLRKAYDHAKPIAHQILSEEVQQHYKESKKLTKFLKNRDLTFSKKTAKGVKTFVVPCTTTIVPLQKSLFNELETAAQILLVSLRKILQDIYGSQNLESSSFIQHLPAKTKAIFIDAIKQSPHYYPQLHHSNMKEYPFFDNVGLDLVLVKDYMERSTLYPGLLEEQRFHKIPELPFKILELNAGSPSGGSNNMNMIEGLYEHKPEMLKKLGKVMPNDHFQVLGSTYKSLGENWTKVKNGIQIILPPGGQNGASPEIHQLAAYSGLIYCDADQLYQDHDGFIRMRTSGKENPIVTAIYSRVNSDSALYDPKKGLLLKHPETGENIYLRDGQVLDENGNAKLVLDANGKKIPLQSHYKIPGAIDAIINRKLYMGGLNRILDNKIILATLTSYGPKFYQKELRKLGLSLKHPQITPPETLPPTRASVQIIEQDPDNWVVKAPDQAGGQGVYILKTLSKHDKQKVLDMIKKEPELYAYQQLVKIARIPVAVQRQKENYKFANLAADMRIWVFFGGEKTALPRMTHNALVRFAPHEKGKMSSIVNTSAGGGYAPFIITDDTNNADSIMAQELATPKVPVPQQSKIPVFVTAQMVQIGRMLKDAESKLSQEAVSAYDMYSLALNLQAQLKEILSFIHPRSIEHIYRIIQLIESKIDKNAISNYYLNLNNMKLEIVKTLHHHEKLIITQKIRDRVESLLIMNDAITNNSYHSKHQKRDREKLKEIRALIKISKISTHQTLKDLRSISRLLSKQINTDFPDLVLSNKSIKIIRNELEIFCEESQERLQESIHTNEYAELFTLRSNVSQLRFETLYLGKKDSDRKISTATQFEQQSDRLLVDGPLVAEELKLIKREWRELRRKSKAKDIERIRKRHFKKFPQIAELQRIIDQQDMSIHSLGKLVDALPYAKFNLNNFATEHGTNVQDVFSTTLQKNKICILDEKARKRFKLNAGSSAGGCFAKKLKAHGLYSKSNIYIWVRKELDPITMLYTIGHELIHYQQIKSSMEAEKRALKESTKRGLSMAKFINYYGNFLGANERSLDAINFNMNQKRTPLYGYSDQLAKTFHSPVISELRQALNRSEQLWEEKLKNYGSLFGLMMPINTGTRVKALQEVIPAFENAKNIIFAQDLGLRINIDPVKSALPTANKRQLEFYRSLICSAARKAKFDWEALRIIGSHQFFGVTFMRALNEKDNLSLTPPPFAINIGNSYNQTQQ